MRRRSARREQATKKNGEVISFLKDMKELGVDIDKLLANSLGAGRSSDKGAGAESKFAAVGKLVANAPAFKDVWAALAVEGGGGGGV